MTLERLARWKEAGAITDIQFNAISTIVRKERFSVFFELNALLYLGVLSFAGGLGWVIQVYVSTLGDAAILSGLSVILLASFYYCFSRAAPFSPGQAESPNLGFDYVLYLGCLTFGIEIGYLESRFHLMSSDWNYYLLISAALFFGLAYRFDNRLVLSLALSTLAGWFGVRMSRFDFFSRGELGRPAMIYGAVVIAAGTWLNQRNMKKHFTETYFHVAAVVVFVALLWGVFDEESSLYEPALVFLAAIAIIGGIRFNRFAFVVYGILFSYTGVSYRLLHGIPIDSTAALAYLALSGSLVIVFMIAVARRFGREQ